MTPLPLQFLAVLLASWLCRQQQEAIGYLQEEDLVLGEQRGGKRLSSADALT